MERVKFTELSAAGDFSPTLRPGPLWFPMFLVFFALLLATSTVRAHGGSGYYQIAGKPMGDYTIHVWTSPGLLRTGEVHVDTAVFDARGMPAFDTLIMVTFTAMDTDTGGEPASKTAIAGSPYALYPYTREARFMLNMPGEYRLDIMLSDPSGMVGMATMDVYVQTITGSMKFLIFALGLLSAACGLWLVLHARSFWTPRMRGAQPDIYPKPLKLHNTLPEQPDWNAPTDSDHGGAWGRHPALPHMKTAASLVNHPQGRRGQYLASWYKGDLSHMAANLTPVGLDHAAPTNGENSKAGWYARLNGPYHARALWIFMLIVVAHWLEHVLQIYQIYGLGWAPSAAGGLIGIFYPMLITSEILHFVYDFIQWAGIVALRGGFQGRARKLWIVAMVAQTWHFIEHVLLMGQYLTGYYFFGRVKQTSILEYFVPREELHFMYNLVVFVPMVIAVHYYLRRKVERNAHALD